MYLAKKKDCLVFLHYTPMLCFMVFSYKGAFKKGPISSKT